MIIRKGYKFKTKSEAIIKRLTVLLHEDTMHRAYKNSINQNERNECLIILRLRNEREWFNTILTAKSIEYGTKFFLCEEEKNNIDGLRNASWMVKRV